VPTFTTDEEPLTLRSLMTVTVSPLRRSEQSAVSVQEIHEQERADALVAVGKRMILDDEIRL